MTTTKTTKSKKASGILSINEAKIESAVNGILGENWIKKVLLNKDLICPENTNTICDYVLARKSDSNISTSTRRRMLTCLYVFAKWVNKNYYKTANFLFKDIDRNAVKSYLDSLQKPLSEDENSKWIGTRNADIIILQTFYRWLFHSDMPQEERPLPDCVSGIKKMKRKGNDSFARYTPSDLWQPKEHLVFLKYCPSTRNKAYHALALDTGARPHELLNLKIKDLKERLIPSTKDQNGRVIKPECIIYQFTVTGKTGSRGLAVTNSLPYVQEWLKQHPQSQNRDAPLFIGDGHSHYKAITTGGLNNIYMKYYRKEYFPSLLNNPNVPAEDKEIINTMLNERKWNPYVIRHSSLTLKSKKLSDQMLKQHAGWSKMSKMPSIYLHQYGTESVDELLKMDGYLPSEDTFNFNPLGLKKCGSCGTVNLPESISCSHCKLLIDLVAYQHILKEQEEKDKELQTMKDQVKEIQTLLSNPAKLLEIIRRDKENDEKLR